MSWINMCSFSANYLACWL